MSEPLLALAGDLERRDGLAAGEAARLDELARELEELRSAAVETAGFLDALPAARAALAAEAAAAASARTAAAATLAGAEARLEQARKDDERLAAERAVQHARDALREAERRVERAAAERSRLEEEAERRSGEAAELEARAQALAGSLGELPRVAHEAALAPVPGLASVLRWAEEARGALLLASAGLAGERDRIAREATELVAAISGDPYVFAGVAGVRERVVRELGRRAS